MNISSVLNRRSAVDLYNIEDAFFLKKKKHLIEV